MARPSLNQPSHRRPSWAKNESTYKANIINASTRPRAYNPDYGLDNFSFDKSHVPEFEMPVGLAQQLPAELHDAASHWVLAGAAVATAVARIDRLEDEAAERVENRTMQRQLQPRRDSGQSASSVGTKSPVLTPSTSSKRSLVASLTQYNKFPFGNPQTQLPTSMIGMESPPYTPIDTQGPGTPSDSINGPTGTVPDLQRVTAQLSPLSSQDSLTITSKGNSTRSNIAEEMHIKKYNAEIYDLKKECYPRLKGASRAIDRLVIELEMDRDVGKELRMTLRTFKIWWARKKPKVSEYQRKVSLLHEKVLGGGMAAAA